MDASPAPAPAIAPTAAPAPAPAPAFAPPAIAPTPTSAPAHAFAPPAIAPTAAPAPAPAPAFAPPAIAPAPAPAPSPSLDTYLYLHPTVYRRSLYQQGHLRPTLWCALPAIEELQTAWEEKQKDPRFDIYQDAIQDGLDKLQKYYSKFDEKPNYVLALVLHPYYKLEYIRMAWGGAKEQQEEIKAGNKNARNWHAEAQDLVEATMARYWRTRPGATTSTDTPVPTDTPSPTDTPLASDRRQAQHGHLSDFDRWRETLIAEDETGWEEELRSYLKTVPKEVTKDTDIIEWWSKNQHKYPTLARIALDILPCQASSVPCERLFSGSKQTATDRRARLGASRFEELQIMKSAWRGTIVDFADINSWEVEIVKADLDVYAALLDEDVALEAWDIGYNEVSSY
ncbi:putative hAT family C-terminal dimerisation region [Lyophyllum shimeji]|uniref:HAT family C-terminal dimerisation region n=1 Tax=Lyophyllum shimeji TaxID=47721 RepID=A0A9P3PJ82_LYOSH|nr:putative hAT family C-terminal dimerisation region [Lyophyllum shimeji]